ncbi:MAG TPA: tetratricopeptide repeat protein [Chthonomonadaceae bacterium]|nr:tetratricopeptide repeat protein [Chthonomonadaceae bacterium]
MIDATQHNPSICPLVIRLFGPFDVRLHGKLLPYLRTRKGQWLLALLALRHDRPVDRDWLAGTLWPESPASQALYNLRRSLSDLRRALGSEGARLASPTARTICLSLTDARTDVSLFDAAIARGDAASLEEAVSLYRGPLLEGCTLEWVVAERRERELAYLAALETLAAQAMAHQEVATATHYLRLVVATDPLRESAQRALLEALAADGDLAAATLAYREFRLYLHRELNAEPAPETSALFQQIRNRTQDSLQKETPSESLRAPSSLPGPLPLPLTGFVGRAQEITDITGLLASTRLVTLMGPGGVGKTRLAIQLARQLAGNYPAGVGFVDLAGLTDAAQIPQAIASVLGVRERKPPLFEALIEHLRGRQLLLVLDNFEPLVDEGAVFVRGLLERTSGLTCLVTSRQRLGVEGEQEFVVAPLLTPSLPGTPERLLEFPSVQLFVDRAQAAQADFRLTHANAPIIAAICHRLEGIPLAIELAAARIVVITPAQMLAELERRLDFLRSRRRDITERHRSLRAALEASYRQLPSSLQRFFSRLSVFRGGWTLEAARTVCEEPLALDYLEALREASFVLAEVETDSAEIRFRMLETLREYAEEKLTPEDRTGLKERHRDYFLTLAEAAEEALVSTEQARWLHRLEQEHDNLRAALQHCLEDEDRDVVKGLRLVASLFRFWHHRGHWSEGHAWCERVLGQRDAQEGTQWRAKALCVAAFIEIHQGDYNTAQAHYEEALAISREIEDRSGIAGSLGELGSIAHTQGNLEEAQALYTQSLQLHRELGNRFGAARPLLQLGVMRASQGEWKEAQSLYEEALALNREAGNRAWEAICLNYLGNLVLDQGRYEEARSLYEQALVLNRDLEDKRGIAASLVNLGNAAAHLQEAAAARAYYEESLFLNRELGARHGVAIVLDNLGPFLCDQGDYAAARDYLVECLELCQELGTKWIAVTALEGMAAWARAQGQVERAVRLVAATGALREAFSFPRPPQDQEKVGRHLAALRADAGEEAFSAAWEEGLAMTLDQAVASALADETGCNSESIRGLKSPVRRARK